MHLQHTDFFQEGNLLLSHPLNCSLLKREVFVQFYFSQCYVMRLPQMIYNQFLWVMFPQWEWFGYEQAILCQARLSLCPIGHLLPVSNQKGFMQGLFQVQETLVSSQILMEMPQKLVLCQKEEFFANMAACCSLASFFLFFLGHFFLLGWSVQITLKVNTEMSKSDFYLSHNRDNSC